MNDLTDKSRRLIMLSSDILLKNTQERFYVDPKTINKLLESSMNTDDLCKMSLENLKKLFAITDEEATKIHDLLKKYQQVVSEYTRLKRSEIKITTIYEANYPKSLKEKLGDDAPFFIYYAGDLSIFNTDGVAIVGSRNVNEEGTKIAYKLGEMCAKENLTVFSGGAKGVDSLAQQGCLDNNGKVVSILSCEMSKLIKIKTIRDSIMNGNLLLVSAVHPDARFNVVSAMKRNKYIYAASKAAIVVSSDKNKGGTWAGATENLRKKYVPMFVVKYDTMPEGNVELLKKTGVTPLMISDDLCLRTILMSEKNPKEKIKNEANRKEKRSSRKQKENSKSNSDEQLSFDFRR